MKTYAECLKDTLEKIVSKMDELLDASEILHDPNRYEKLAAEFGEIGVAISPFSITDSIWREPDQKQQILQREFLEIWEPWVEHLRLLFSADTQMKHLVLEKTIGQVELWIQRNRPDYSIPKTIDEAKEVFREKTKPLQEALDIFCCAEPEIFIVPDTNILLKFPDVENYADYLKVGGCTVWLMPAVLHELDSHKVNHRVDDVREKAKKFTKRLKGWRQQGSLAAGVKVQGKVFLRVEGKEPKFERTLSWLQADVQDDRILASVLELQRRYPSAAIALVSLDTNMLTKADAAFVHTEDFQGEE